MKSTQHPIKTFSKILRSILWLSMAGVLSFALILTASVLYISPNLPTVDSLKEVKLQTPLRIYTADKKLMAEYGEKRREPLHINQVPDLLIKALLAAEDKNFYGHHGVDLKGLLRASYELITTGHIHSGGSTITMQVARNYFLSSQQTFMRKFNEILLAIKMERSISKSEILELYINKIYLGNRAYGFGAAAKIYYSKELSQLSLAELAMIAGLPKAPSKFNPIVDPERALIRRDWILKRMLELNFIDAQQYQSSVAEPLSINPQVSQQDAQTLYIAEMARQDIISRLGPQVYDNGYTVITTIDSSLQTAANEAIINGLITYDQRHGYRGPEAHLQLPAENSDQNAYWQKKLSQFMPTNNLLPGVVTATNATTAIVLLKNGSSAALELAQARWARKYISDSQLGPTPKNMADLLSIGDVVRLQPPTTEDLTWKLAQIPRVQGALVAIDPNNGAIKSLMGGFSYDLSNFNRAAQANRQAGSSIKPFIYAAALAKGFTAASIINDAPLVFENTEQNQDWRPENATGTFLGPTRLRKALYESRNLVSIRLLDQMGIPDTLNYLTLFGFDVNRFPKDLSLALGSVELTPMQVASAFTVFANGGYKVEPYLIETILDSEGNVVYQAAPKMVCHTCAEDVTTPTTEGADLSSLPKTQPAIDEKNAPRVIDAKVAYIMQSMLKDVITRGTGVGARVLKRKDIAGKTGTTNEQKDAWFTGFNGDLVASVWVGFDTPSALGAGEHGARAALPIWVDYMRAALQNKPETKYAVPKGIVTLRIDPDTGLRAAPNQANAISEIFAEEHQPEGKAETTSPDTDSETPTTEPPPPMEQLF